MFEEPTLTVAQLSAGIGAALQRSFPDEVWVRGEIANLSRPSSGHVYFDLVGDGVGIGVTLWSSDRHSVNRVLRRAGGAVRITDGTEVRIRAKVSWFARRGTVSLAMLGIDTAYTLGRLAEARQRLVQTLRAQGLLARQGALALSAVPLRVGLVTSEASAAAADFLHTLEASEIGWQLVLADARVQGVDAEASLLGALRTLARPQGRPAGEPDLDVVCVVRGGGARTDLAAFDLEGVARAIATCPVPVLTGVGHETDTTVADLVAYRGFKTPTACAGFLVERVRTYRARCGTAWEAVQRRAGTALARADADLDLAAHRAGRACRHHLHGGEQALLRATVRLAARGPALLDGAERALDGHAARVRGLDPARTLARGWTITHDARGRLVRSAGDVDAGDELVTTVADGTVRSRVR